MYFNHVGNGLYNHDVCVYTDLIIFFLLLVSGKDFMINLLLLDNT